MKTRKFISNELLASIDVLNTVNGGVSEPQLKLKQFQDHREIWVKVAGVSEESLKVEIHNNLLRVFYSMNVATGGISFEIPKVVYNKPIPYFVDLAKIFASCDDEFLVVTLPFNELTGYHREVSTGK